ncbi:MAG: TolC family protein [Bacteriovoracia bacterium]
MKKLLIVSFLLGLTSAISTFAAEISVNDYLGQVQSQSPNYKASELSAEGQSLQKSTATLITAPYLFAGYQNLDDRQEMMTPAFSGDRTQGNTYSVGLGMNTIVGLNAKYSFNVAHAEIKNATLLPLPNYYTSYNKLELTQSLLRNGFGSEVRARRDAQRWLHEARSLGDEFQLQMKLVEAENTFYRLAFARRAIQVQQAVLARAERILSWAKRRVNNQLGDRADLLQAQSSYDIRRLELQSALEEQRVAARAFNLLRNAPGDTVNEGLQLPTIEQTIHLVGSERKAARLDLAAAEAQTQATIASAQLEKEAVKPTLDVFANIAWNGRDAKRSEAIREAQKSSHSTTAFGVNLNLPLAFGAIDNSWKGLNMSQEAARLDLEHKRLAEDRDWRDLSARLVDARTRLELLQKIEDVQRDKFENERQRLLRGRTTTYQALMFEQDYAQSQLLSLRTQAEVLQVISQLKLFRGEQ